MTVKKEEEENVLLLKKEDSVEQPSLSVKSDGRFLKALVLLVSTGLILLTTIRFNPISYYRSAGTYNPSAKLDSNPLPIDSPYADIPFAVLANPPPALDSRPVSSDTRPTTSNGTHLFQKTVILISLDGVRADYLDLGLTPHLLNIAQVGLRAEYLQPVFPSLTFPNHYSLLTGLYPASHGIVANDFYDPDLDEEFVYTDPTKSWDGKWWLGEPIWATAVKNGLKSANLMWPSPPKLSNGVSPTYWFPFQNHYRWNRKLEKLLSWIDLPSDERPQLIIGYLPEVDQIGHLTGTHSPDLKKSLQEMDHFAGGLFKALESRNLTNIIEVIFVSDHGMTDTDNEKLIFLDDILGAEGYAGIASSEGWPNAGLRFKSHIDQDDMLRRLLEASKLSIREDGDRGFNVYTAETMLERWHFSGHERIAPIFVVPSEGWAVTNHHDFHVKMDGSYSPKGNHGYDNAYNSMHAMFVAHGPFVEAVKSARLANTPLEAENHKMNRTAGFANLEVYNLVAQLLGIEKEGKAANNGTEGFWDSMLVK